VHKFKKYNQSNISMNPIIINNFDEFYQYVGKELGVSEYIQITQQQINTFADATLDHQWIHVDEERCKTESPFKTTIAHGYLNLSVLPHLWEQIVEVRNSRLTVNYGIEKLRFMQAVTVGSRVRCRAKLHSLVNLRGTSKAEIYAVLEIEGSKKPALEANIVFLYHFVE
jgi:acyl dehydratase